jgi:hypothetical protein
MNLRLKIGFIKGIFLSCSLKSLVYQECTRASTKVKQVKCTNRTNEVIATSELLVAFLT